MGARRGGEQAEGARAKRRLEELRALSAGDAILKGLLAEGHAPTPAASGRGPRARPGLG